MIFENSFPPVKKGITVLFDIQDTVKPVVCGMLGKENVEDKYIYFVGVDTLQFQRYYVKVCRECDELNKIFFGGGEINECVVAPKHMFLFDDMNSCKNFKGYFEKIEDSTEKVRYELAYGSTDCIAQTLTVFRSNFIMPIEDEKEMERN